MPMLDSCLEPGKIDSLKMLDLQTKSAINSNILQVQHQASNLLRKTGLRGNEKTQYVGLGRQQNFIKMLKLRPRYVNLIATLGTIRYLASLQDINGQLIREWRITNNRIFPKGDLFHYPVNSLNFLSENQNNCGSDSRL